MRDLCKILEESKTIAVVGISNKPGRVSRSIANYLKNAGYNVVGVNPNFDEVDGIKVYPSLSEIPFQIDIVDVFRKSSDIPEIIPGVLEVKPKTLWLQLGIRNDEAVADVKKSGIEVVQDECIKVTHSSC